jgi:hypothetical protein
MGFFCVPFKQRCHEEATVAGYITAWIQVGLGGSNIVAFHMSYDFRPDA